MYQKPTLDYNEANNAVEAVMAAAANQEPLMPVSVAVVDLNGDMIYFARMDNSTPSQVRLSTNKAYTAALFRRATSTYAGFMKEFDLTLAAWGDSRYTNIAGGLCIITEDDVPLAGIGLSGLPKPEWDEELLQQGLKAAGLAYR